LWLAAALGSLDTQKSQEMHYRKEIDGLRAVAVCSVILYHADIEPFGGGFIGVDIFFVISGFLITGLILEDLSLGDF
jgi:peptidoglycan/LPS O-acetylase OafA/YrhL